MERTEEMYFIQKNLVWKTKVQVFLFVCGIWQVTILKQMCTPG